MSKIKLAYTSGKYAGKKLIDIVKTLKKNLKAKKAKQAPSKRSLAKKTTKANVARHRQGLKSLRPFNIRAGARNDKVIPIKKQSQKGSSFRVHNVKTPGANSARGMGLSRYGSEGSASSWRADMDRFQEIPLSSFFKKKKALGGVMSLRSGGDTMPARNKKNFRSTKSGAGMTAAGVAAYRRKNPGSKLSTAVTEDNPGKKRAARRKSYCARSLGQMKKFPKAAKDPNSRLRQARRRWKC
tara:strand:+ start:634 stop:1353 length:720 start_codon:yes stop_codon:yes gene_type:complete